MDLKVKLKNRFNNHFVIIYPEDIPLIKHRKIMEYYAEFKEAIGNHFYPLEVGMAQIEKWLWLVKLIGEEINNQIVWEEIVELDLYNFFIANINEEAEKPIALRSNLELLLGFRDLEAKAEEDIATITVEKEDLSTGDLILDVTTITLLNFKHGYNLIKTHSLTQLMKMNEYAAALQEKASKEAEEKYDKDKKDKKLPTSRRVRKIAQPVAPTEQQTAIADKVSKKGIPTPDL